MARVTTRIEPIERDVALLIDEELTPEAQSRHLAAFARESLAEAQQVNRQALGRVPPHETFVDGRAEAPLETVLPGGRISFEFELLDDLFAWIGAQLVQHSPVRSGRFAASHVFTADGVAVEPGADVPPAQEYVFVNTMPYARKIERGLSPQAPEGVYEAVALLASRRFGNVARIRFSFRSPLFGAVGSWAAGTQMAARGRQGAKRDAWLTRQPAIVITV